MSNVALMARLLNLLPAPWRVDKRPYGNGVIREVRAANDHLVVTVLQHGGYLAPEITDALASLIAAAGSHNPALGATLSGPPISDRPEGQKSDPGAPKG
jgi:hypothetical protein